MTWTNQPATENQAGLVQGLSEQHNPSAAQRDEHAIKIRKTSISSSDNRKETETFTLTLGGETIELVPLKNWGQLDVYKWGMRGKLPGTPAGLEITSDHVKVLGETVSTSDPDGCSKLERIFNDWLSLEKQTVELARAKAQTKHTPVAQGAPLRPEEQVLRFQVELDKESQVHIRCLRGKEIEASIGLNLPGFHSLCSQGFMRKPHSLRVGALHDWVEIDGVLYSFEKGNDDTLKLEKALNTSYIPMSALGSGKAITVLANAASSTGFDVQFPVTVAGASENRKRHLNEEAVEILQDPTKCGLLHPSIVIKLTRPTLIFKQKTPDGGERYLPKSPENLVIVADDDGNQKTIDLSQPVNYLQTSALELTAVFNHPAINRHSKTTAATRKPVEGQKKAASASALPQLQPQPPATPAASKPAPQIVAMPAPVVEKPLVEATTPVVVPPRSTTPTSPAAENPRLKPAEPPKPMPNSWLKTVLAQPPIRHDWFAYLVYARLAESLGRSNEGTLGLSACWAVALSDIEDIAAPDFRGVFLTEKGGLGFIDHGYMVRFNKGAVFIGTQESAIEGIDVRLIGVGLDPEHHIFFIASDNYRSKFDVPEPLLKRELARLKECGASVMGSQEILDSPESLEVVWTVPIEQQDATNPQVTESTRPELEEPSPEVGL